MGEYGFVLAVFAWTKPAQEFKEVVGTWSPANSMTSIEVSCVQLGGVLAPAALSAVSCRNV